MYKITMIFVFKISIRIKIFLFISILTKYKKIWQILKYTVKHTNIKHILIDLYLFHVVLLCLLRFI